MNRNYWKELKRLELIFDLNERCYKDKKGNKFFFNSFQNKFMIKNKKNEKELDDDFVIAFAMFGG